MQWNEFLDQLRQFKSQCKAGQLRLDYGTLSTLLYAGAFDSFENAPKGLSELHAAAEALKDALGSDAQPKEAKKTELWGIADIDSEVRLHLWRNQVLPTTTFRLCDYFSTALQQLGYMVTERSNMPYRSSEHDLWVSWQVVQSDPRIHRFYLQKNPPRSPAFVGMLEDVTSFQYGTGKEALRLKFTTGLDYLPTVVVWPGRDGKISERLKAALVKKAYGVAAVRLSEYKGDLSLNLLNWSTVRC